MESNASFIWGDTELNTETKGEMHVDIRGKSISKNGSSNCKTVVGISETAKKQVRMLGREEGPESKLVAGRPIMLGLKGHCKDFTFYSYMQSH